MGNALIDHILTLPVMMSASVFIVATVLLALASYAVARWARPWSDGSETRELAGSVTFRIAALHGLVLALVFAQELGNIRDVQTAAAREASLVSDIFHDLERFDPDATGRIRRDPARYAVIVAEEEWDRLASDARLSLPAWDAWESAYLAILDLPTETLAQERLMGFMLHDIRELSALRDARENAALSGASSLFLFAAIAGVVLISAAWFTWAPTALHLGLMAGFAAYTGLIVFFVVAYANPYHAPGNAEPTGFERFLTDRVRAVAAEPD
ncbi:hypothetical protein SAMN04488011_103324 [Palleronia pelagia]|uniref:DUF4239 domain-containing protein n=1 Tax=Palleronia pelagia TaxID=387096 RepID=A0A1H8FG52_9RHOB|nr:hypothetical protein SAMN04488011_103324 [Palleronia pelagia]